MAKKRKVVAAKASASKKTAPADLAKAANKAAATAGADETVKRKADMLIPVIDKKALQKDVGIKVIAAMCSARSDDDEANKLKTAAAAKNFDAQSQLTFAIVNAALADKSIDLAPAFGEDKKLYGFLTNQIGLALGYREVVETPKGGQTVAYSKAVHAYFPAPGDDKDAPETMQKNTYRQNFLHRLKQCLQGAAHIVASKTKAEIDKKAGTLRITGPAVKEQFGVSSVLLNGKEKTEDAKGNEVTLKSKPSFTAMATKAGEAYGLGSAPRVQNAGGTRGLAVDPNKAIESLAKSLIAAIERIKDVNDTVRAQLNGVSNAIKVKLGNVTQV